MCVDEYTLSGEVTDLQTVQLFRGDLSRSLKGAVKEMPRSETPVRVWNTRLRCNQSERVGYKYTCGVSSCDGAGGKFHPVNIRLSNSIPPTRYHPSLFM